MALIKADIAEHLTQTVGFSKCEAKDIVEDFFEVIRENLAGGERVKLSGFGNFNVRSKAERPGRNPRTGEVVPVCARKVVTFKAGQKFKARFENKVLSKELEEAES